MFVLEEGCFSESIALCFNLHVCLPSQNRVTSDRFSDSRSPWNAERMLDSYLLHLSLYFSLPILLKVRLLLLLSLPSMTENVAASLQSERKTRLKKMRCFHNTLRTQGHISAYLFSALPRATSEAAPSLEPNDVRTVCSRILICKRVMTFYFLRKKGLPTI